MSGIDHVYVVLILVGFILCGLSAGKAIEQGDGALAGINIAFAVLALLMMTRAVFA